MNVSLRAGLPVINEWPSWEVRAVSKVSYKEIECLVENLSATPVVVKGLPLEFFNHELAGLNALDDRQVIEFASTWGIPHSPFFGSWKGFLASRERKASHGSLVERLKDAGVAFPTYYDAKSLRSIEERLVAEAYEKHFEESWWGVSDEKLFWPEEARSVARSRFVQLNRRPRAGDGGIIALDEVRRTIVNLQEATRIMSYLDEGVDEQEVLERIESDYAMGAPTHSPFIRSIGQGLVVPEKLRGWSAEAGRYIMGFLWPLSSSLIGITFGSLPGIGSHQSIGESGLYGVNEAVAIQFFYELGDGNPWQVCGYEGCARRFKYQRKNREPRYFASNKRGGTEFCCKSHSVMENRRRNELAEEAARAQLAKGLSREGAAGAMRDGFTEAQIERALSRVFEGR